MKKQLTLSLKNKMKKDNKKYKQDNKISNNLYQEKMIVKILKTRKK